MDILSLLMANDMEALKGLEVSGEIAVSETLLNKVAAEVLADLQNAPNSAKPEAYDESPSTNTRSTLKLQDLLPKLKRLHLRPTEGKLMIDVEVKL